MIDKIIGDLLLKHNCVIVPGFGGFVAKKTSARIDYDSGKMFPPTKSLLFNRQLINNDGLLVNSLAEESKVKFADAQIEVDNQVILWKSILKNEGRVELDRIGFLFLDEEKNLCFEQDRSFNLLLESYGLGEIHFLSQEDVGIADHIASVKEKKVIENAPIIQPTLKEEIQVAPVVEMKIGGNQKELSRKSKTWKYLAAACLLPIGFYTFWLPMKTDVLESGILSLNDFNPFHNTVEAQYEPSENEIAKFESIQFETIEEQTEDLSIESNVYSMKLDEDNFVHVQIQEETFAENDILESVSTPVVSENVHFIVGCFSSESNANNLVLFLKENGFENAKEVDMKNGLHRISAGSGASVQDLQNVRQQANSLQLQGWFLK